MRIDQFVAFGADDINGTTLEALLVGERANVALVQVTDSEGQDDRAGAVSLAEFVEELASVRADGGGDLGLALGHYVSCHLISAKLSPSCSVPTN